ncbi:MAG: THUMP domain-containing protein, partial [Coriobacteriales bacterium]|nr:THUMP domain-containing protein [Coriobacteriales bacterium]
MAFEYLATCAKGAEKVLARELAALRVKRVRPLTAGVSFAGTLEDGYRALLWLRTASRVLLVLGRVDAACADALYEGVLALPWEEHVNAAGSIAVDARGTNDELRNTQFVAVRVKDAVCDRLREVRGERPRVDRDRPSVRINVALRGSRATIALDLAGEPLHRRGYRRTGGGVIEAPLKETLAATMLLAAGWSEQSSGLFTGEAANAAGEPPGKEQSHFLDPLCGSGTLAIEAGLIAFDIAPGIARDYWGFTGWLGHEPALWDALLDEADRRAEAAATAEDERLAATGAALIYASDFDPAAVKVALDNAKRAGLAGRIAFEVAAVEKVQLPDAARLSPGLLACNPPYGERLATSSQLPALYAALA